MSDLKGRRKYPNPPIDEALCEFQFVPNQDWDLTIPGKLHQRIGDQYKGKPRNQKVIEAHISLSQEPQVQQKERLARVQLPNDDATRLVAIGEDVLSIHMLRPYQRPGETKSGWEEFLPRIEQALEAYWAVADPKGVRRIGVRYINGISIPQESVNLGDFFICGPRQPATLPQHMNNFFTRVEYSYPDGVKLILTFGTVGGKEQPEFLLDLDMVWESSDHVGRARALEIATDLRDRERDAFEAVITEKSRALFE